MDLLEIIKDIKTDCYLDKFESVFCGIEEFIQELSRQEIVNDIRAIEVLKVLLKAIDKKDIVLIGDCLEYGIKPLLINNDVQTDLFREEFFLTPEVKRDCFYMQSFDNELCLYARLQKNEYIRMNSAFSPINEVDNWVNNIGLKSTTPAACLFGLGTGLFAEAVLNKISENSRLFIYEPNRDIIDYCINCSAEENADILEIKVAERIKRVLNDKRVSLIIESEKEDSFLSTLRELEYIAMKGLVVVKHNNYERLYPESFLRYLKEINAFRKILFTNKNVLNFFKEKYIEDFFLNIWNIRDIYSFSDVHKILPNDVPVIIVSAGPSLKKNVSVLQQAKGHCLIVAVDTAIRFLLKNNIIPDVTITLDPIKPSTYYTDDDRACNVPCIIEADANPDIMARLKGPKILFNIGNYYVDRLFYSIGKGLDIYPACGGSVATAAFNLFYALGQKKIILIGQDLAFDNGVSHVGNESDGAKLETKLVDGVNGEKVLSRADWIGFLEWFERRIDRINALKEDVRVIDATEGGALIHGSEVMTLEQVIKECLYTNGSLIEYDFEKEIKGLNTFFSFEEYNMLLKKHAEAINKLKEIRLKAEEAIYICKKLLKGIEDGTVSDSYIDKEKRKITKINEFCSKSLIFPIINNYVVTDVVDDISLLMLSEGDEKTKEINGIKMLRISFEAILEATKTISERIKEIDQKRKELGNV